MSKQFRAPEWGLRNLPQISETEIGDGLSGNIDTIAMMKEIARDRAGSPVIRRLASNILQEYQIPSHHFRDEALAIGDYVKKHVRYLRDPDDIEYLQDPVDMIKQIQARTAQGDCDDMALLVASLLLSVGHQPLFRAVRYELGSGNFNHIYVVVYERNPYGQTERVALDCILKDKPIGTETKQINGQEFPI